MSSVTRDSLNTMGYVVRKRKVSSLVNISEAGASKEAKYGVVSWRKNKRFNQEAVEQCI